MREQLGAVVGELLQHLDDEDVTLSDAEDDKLQKCAEITTMARTAVERGYNGDIINAHEPEMPTRFTKQLMQVVRGGVAIGLSRNAAMKLAIRIAKDSIPPLRLEIILDIAANPDSRPGDVCKRINKPWTTVKREMEALCMIGILDVEIEESETEDEGRAHRKWLYAVAESFRHDTLLEMAGIDPGDPETWQPPHRKVITPIKRDYHTAQAQWQAAIKRAWLADHPGKNVDDYERAGSCGDTEEGERDYHKWFDGWLAREGRAIHRHCFRGTEVACK
jgi:hypothetical protein